MRDAFEDLIEFERACGHEPSDGRPGDGLSDGLVKLRCRLIDEEHNEFLEAVYDNDMAGVADALADLIYVAIGTAVRFGIDLPKVWNAVHESNLQKFGPGSWVREDGKRMKPPSWVPPDIKGILENQPTLAETYGNPPIDTRGDS